MTKRPDKPSNEELHDRILGHFAVLCVPMKGDDLDAALTHAERDRLSHLEFLESLIGAQANGRRERAIERRIHEARFSAVRVLEGFDWEFNRRAIDRAQMEALATCDFVRRRENIVVIGQSGVGKSHLMQAIGRRGCVLGYRVRYTTSATLLQDLIAGLADKTLPQRLRRYDRYELLIIDEFGLDKIEREESPVASSLMYKVIDARRCKLSTVIITNIDFEAWGSYLGDPPLAMAVLDRIVDNATVIKINGRSYPAAKAKKASAPPAEK